MKMARRTVTLFLGIAWVFLLVEGTTCAQTLHVIMVSDTADETLGRGCRATIAQWESTLEDLIPRETYTAGFFKTHEDEQKNIITAKNVRAFLEWVREVTKDNGEEGIGRKDTLVCLYHGHGARGVLGDHYMELSHNEEWMYSKELRKLVDSIPCKLKVIMTCSCNTGIWDQLFAAPAYEEWDTDEDGIAPVMESLFFDHTGLVHMNASWPGHYSWTNPKRGSWFFNSFLSYCRANPKSTPSWKDMDRILDKELNRRFKQAKEDGSISVKRGNLLRSQRHANIITWKFPRKD